MRLALLVIWLTTDLYRVFDTRLWPLLGWCFLPMTTGAYMLAMYQNKGRIDGGWTVLIVCAVLVDIARGVSIGEVKAE